MPDAGPVSSPSDLAASAPERCRVGGRVTAIDGRTARISDAGSSVDVELPDDPMPSTGELVLLTLQRAGTRWVGRLLERHAGSAQPSGEAARFEGRRGRTLARRSALLATLRGYFAEQGFLEVDTPLRVRTPGLDAHVDAISAQGGWLVTSPELHMKRLLVAGLPRIYQLAHASRAEEQGPLHEPEFALLEWYRAFADQDAVMRDTEELVRRASALREPGARALDLEPPFERLTVREAFRRFAGVADAVDLAAGNESQFFQVLVDQVEPALAALGRPVFLCNYPATQAALARRSPSDPGTAERFELYAGGLELCNGFSELTDPVEQRLRFEQERSRRATAGRPVYEIDERFMSALEEGLPPAGGNALGVDRLLLLISAAERLSDVQSFPSEWR